MVGGEAEPQKGDNFFGVGSNFTLKETECKQWNRTA